MSLGISQRDSSCPNGGVFYSCNKGFVGCCLVEACNPGVGCPADMDTTLNTSSSQGASTTTTTTNITSVVTVAPTPSVFTIRTALSFSTAASEPISASQLAGSTGPALVTETSAPTASAASTNTKHRHDSGDATPTAAIVGAVLGGIILTAITVGLLFCIRHRKRTKVYKTAIYPSPHVGSDMSPQLPKYQELKLSRFAGLIRTKQKFAHHLDSREVVPASEMGEAPPRHTVCAELPASNDNIRNI